MDLPIEVQEDGPNIPPKKNSTLMEVPEIAPRYAPQTSTLDNVEYRNPHKFSLKPPYWEKWSPRDYKRIAEYLETVDLVPISRVLQKPVEEVGHMLHALVTTPLHDAQEASRRGVRGMELWFHLYRHNSTPTRVWGRKKMLGELDEIDIGRVRLILPEGTVGSAKFEDLTEEDFEWLRVHAQLSLSDRRKLSGVESGKKNVHGTEDGWPESSLSPTTGDVAAPRHELRAWTEERVFGRFDGVSPDVVHIVKMNGEVHDIALDAVLEDAADKIYINDHVPRALRTTLLSNKKGREQKSAAANPVAQNPTKKRSADGTTKKQGPYEDGLPSTPRKQTSINGHDTAPISAQASGHRKKGADTPAPAALYATGSKAPPKVAHVFRKWAALDKKAKLTAIAHERAQLICEDGSVEYLSLSDMRRDADWLKQHLSLESRRILSGKAAASDDLQPIIWQAAPDLSDETPSKRAKTAPDSAAPPRDNNRSHSPQPSPPAAEDAERPDESESRVRGSVVRSWTDNNIVGRLVRVSHRKVYLDLGGREQALLLDMLNADDGEFLRDGPALTEYQRKLVMGAVAVLPPARFVESRRAVPVAAGGGGGGDDEDDDDDDESDYQP